MVLAREVEKNFAFKKIMRMPPGRVCVLVGQNVPGQVTLYGVFDGDNGERRLTFRSVKANYVFPLPEELSGLLTRDMVEYLL